MKYKNTYFEISLNSEISVTEHIYDLRQKSEDLLSGIPELEAKITEIFRRMDIKVDVINKDYSFLDTIYNSKEVKEKFPSWEKKDYSVVLDCLRQIIRKKRIFSDRYNRRYTKEHEQALSNHMNEIAEDGWKLLTMTPVIKGLGYGTFGSYNEGGYGYGYGHDVLEGFVLVWEKID